MDPHDIASGFAILVGLAGLGRTFLRRKLTLEQVAGLAVDHGEQLGKGLSSADKKTLTLHAAQRLDEGDNGRRDYNDVRLTIAIEAELQRRSKRSPVT